MGLDMYMDRIKKIDGMTLQQIIDTASYIDYLNRGAKYEDCSYKDWCGGNEDNVCKDRIDDVKANIHTHYSAWDTEKKYGHDGISDGVAYWRKANAIHQWFVNNCGGGVDECQLMEISKAQLETLLFIAKKVKDSCVLVDGKINNGYTFKDGKEVPIMEDGKYIKDSSVAEELLPTTSGFFFGGTEYDQWYLEDIEDTIKQITEILETTDFDNEYITYQASW